MTSERAGEEGDVMDGAALITAERLRQIEEEGWTPEHDDEWVRGQMTAAAESYAFVARCQTLGLAHNEKPLEVIERIPFAWEWDAEWWKPSDDPIRNLVKAGALIAAEIDRLHRAQ